MPGARERAANFSYNPLMTPRLIPEEPLPPYTFVPGRNPHPIRDPAGHSHGHAPPPVTAPTSREWRDCRAHLRAIDLFNAGYYWEAHETWEQVWIALGRSGMAADFFKGLIKLAATGVKQLEGNLQGAARHLRRAAELFGQVRASLSEQDDSPHVYFGIDLRQLPRVIEELSIMTSPGETRPTLPLAE